MSRDDTLGQNAAAPITPILGQTVDRLAFDGLSVSEVTYRPGQRMRPHAHADAIFSMVLHGFSLEHVGSDSFNIAPPLYRYHPPEETHENLVGPAGWRLFNIEVPAHWLERSRDEGQLRQRGLALTGGPMAYLIQRMLREFRFRDCSSRLVMEGLALELVGEAACAAVSYNPVGSKNKWLTQVIDRINGEFGRHLTLGELASAAAVDPTHLARCFRRRFNCTIGDYVRRVRIAFACRKLQSTDVPLKELAAKAGFCNQSHFGRAFRAVVGVTPAQYRQLFRDG